MNVEVDPGLVADIGMHHPIDSVVEDTQRALADAVAGLRSIFAGHPKQAAFFAKDPTNPLRATTKTRRAGATAGGVREFLARALEQPKFRATYATTTRVEAHERAWENDTNSGFAQVLRELGEPVEKADVETVILGGVQIEIRIGDLALEFSNGSRIDLYGADNLRALRKKRGGAKHVFWVDEAQDFPYLDVFYKAVVVAALQDFVGECWLTGTPGRDCAGFFYDITGDEETRLPGWAVHVLAAVDNPFFGRVVQADDGWHVDDNTGTRHGPYESRGDADAAVVDIRWENAAGSAIRQNKFSMDDPDVQRELLGKWVKADARYVYPVHAVRRDVLVYAPQRLRPNTFRAHHPAWVDWERAVEDLPWNRRARRNYQWMYGVGIDFGYRPDPFAFSAFAFSHELPDAYEMFSWKSIEVDTDDQGAYLKMLWDTISPLVAFVGDAANKQDDFEAWKTRLNIDITPANKKGKSTLEEFLANDVRVGRVHFREDSPLLTEMKFLVYLPTKPGRPREVDKHRKVNGVVHGDHNVDSTRYLWNEMRHYLHRPPKDQPPAGTREAYEQEAELHERRVEQAQYREQRKQVANDDAQWDALESVGRTGEDYGYGYGY